MKKDFSYKGISLQEYCSDKDINYSYVLNRKCVLKKKMKLTDQEAIDFILDNYKINYSYYKGIKLEDYCKENNIKHSYIQKQMYIVMEERGIGKQEAINLLIENYKASFIYYDNIPIPEYCTLMGINYDSLAPFVSRLLKKKPMTREAAYAIAIEQYNTGFIMYEGKTMRQYCKDNEYNYNTVLSLRYKYIKRDKMNSEDATNKAIETYVRYIRRIEKTNELMKLRENSNNELYLLDYCKSKNLNLENINILKDLGYTLFRSILILEHINHELNSNPTKLDVMNIIKQIEKDVHEIELDSSDLELTRIIQYYNMGYNNMLPTIFERLKPIINSCVYNNPYYDKAEMRDHMETLVIECLHKNIFFLEQQLRAYMYRYIKGELVKFYYDNPTTLSYNKKTSINDKVDYINNFRSEDDVEEEATTRISAEQIREATIQMLDHDEIKYITIRFGFGTRPHSKEEIAIILNTSIEEIDNYEEEILQKLRQNDKIKSLQ